GPQPRARGRLVEQVRSCPSICVRFSTFITQGVRTEGIWRLTTRAFDRVTSLEAGSLVGAIGRVSRAALLLPGLDLGAATGITTPCPGLFVVGDARGGGLGQIGMAVGDGLAAAMQVARTS
ncbi:MAG: hypothetical protein MUC50_04560, partial [Myxococcota bacterium]|nr:hypothetical protein [Myxococcota bacterium]